ncbi:hypothetical protein, variant [Aphanomyces invadans]|uniref:PH domain-containing protein n=1 Tax=Aphanomyces invadans TaxID=157072 RepID=A0A024TRC4_9STRA|nr:hypothetical protein, variant [Aphanomyces invadans]ETV96573.1 hypothetical protein, variant [Aphanomyces invadans]|eukprot:XP_008874836.1 hypothetical protein, variant [Aphanomyces invadans]
MSRRQLAVPAAKGGHQESFGSDVSDDEKSKIQPTVSMSTASAAPSLVRRASSKKWYSDSDDEGGAGGENTHANNQIGSMSSLQASSTASSSTTTLNRRASASAFLPSRGGNTPIEKAPPPPALDLSSPTGPPIAPVDKHRPPSVSGFQKLVQKTKIMSPFRSKHSKQLKEDSAPPVNQAHDDVGLAHHPSSLETAISPPSTSSTTPAGGGASLQRRHSSRMMLRASSSEASLAPTPEDEADDAFQQNVMDALSPGRGALGGAIAGVPGSGVLLEGWLRQKQRRGIRGLKSWNSRYFVLFKNPNEMRYYSDVVQSGWGPIPLGELGCISLRSIQRISKPSHPKYKGCRFDITCRLPSATIASNTGDYDEGVFSSGDEDKKDKPAKTTPKAATREFCLVSDSPQTTVTWVTMLDSLLTRSVNSPRPDTVNGRRNSSTNVSNASGGGSLKALVTQNIRQKAVLGGLGAATASAAPLSTPLHQTSPTDARITSGTPTVFTLPHDVVPKAIVLAIEYIFESFPGIETERFYTADPPPPARLQVGNCCVVRTTLPRDDVFGLVTRNMT